MAVMGSIDIDYTIIIQLINFLVAVWVVSYFLIKPIREQIKSRQSLMQGYMDEMELFSEQADSKLAAYEASLDAAREEAQAVRGTFVEKGHAQETTIVTTAQDEALALLKATRDETVKEAKKALTALKKQVPGFAENVVSKILQ